MEKRTVNKIYHVDNYTVIRAIVIGIAYHERMKNRKNFLHRASNQQVGLFIISTSLILLLLSSF